MRDFIAELRERIEGLRAERDGLLLKDRATKNRPAHKARYAEVTRELNEAARLLRQRIGGTS